MAIKNSDLLNIDLPAAYWDWILAAIQSVPVAHKESDPIVRALSAKMMEHVRRDQEADAVEVIPPE
jgi:hypothetical protein